MKLMLFAPELFMLLGSLLIFFFSLTDKDGKNSRLAAIGTAIGTMVITLSSMSQKGTLFFDAYQNRLERLPYATFFYPVSIILIRFIMSITYIVRNRVISQIFLNDACLIL